MISNMPARVLDKISPEPNSGCWFWTGALNNGYGVTGIQSDGKWRTLSAHRFVYEAVCGKIPEGLQLDHLCRMPACVNPDHLEPVTLQENLARGIRGGGGWQRNKTHCKWGHEFTPENTIIKYVKKNGKGRTPERVCRECNKRRCLEYMRKRRSRQ